MSHAESSNEEVAARRRAMGLFARARLGELGEPVTRRWPEHGARDLKPVETGLVMLRGRAGGDGAPFNVGEATVTRAIVELPSGAGGASAPPASTICPGEAIARRTLRKVACDSNTGSAKANAVMRCPRRAPR